MVSIEEIDYMPELIASILRVTSKSIYLWSVPAVIRLIKSLNVGDECAFARCWRAAGTMRHLDLSRGR
jgi:hypothetical protein